MGRRVIQTVEERFWDKVDKTEYCWNWTAYLQTEGYGHFGINSRLNMGAHRFAYKLTKGEIPKGLQIDHLCRNRKCVNPEHLEAVTKKVNVLRGIGPTAINKRKTHCIHGHELSKDNICSSQKGRHCRICQNFRSKIYYHKKKVIINE